MRRIGGILLLVVLTACGDGTTVEQTGPEASAPPESTTTTMATTTTTVLPTATTSTTVARATTTVAPRTVPTTARVVPTTAASGDCDPNYSGACIPSGPDVDCGEISAKRFRVIGQDVHRLDADNDGIACES